MTVKWGFIGSSGWVRSQFAPSVILAGNRVGGAFGSSPAGSAEFAAEFDCTAYESLEELITDPTLDALWIASPTGLHERHVLKAALTGKALLIEKPLAPDISTAERIAGALKSSTSVVSMGFQNRFHPGIRLLHEALRDGKFGRVVSLYVRHSSPSPGLPSGWRADSASGGWAIGDIGTHLLDIARMLLGDLRPVGARLSSPALMLSVDDVATLLLASGDANVLIHAATAVRGGPSLIELEGTDGWARLTDFWSGGGTLQTSWGEVSFDPADTYVEQVRAFSSAVEGGNFDGSGIVDGVWASRIMEFGARSS
jgi:predicted dehydrogenase